jgi:hypothetical protein
MPTDDIGRKLWSIAEGYMPSESCSSERALLAHEAACILNASDREAHVAATIHFAEREPADPYSVVVAPRRTFRSRFTDLNDPEPAPLALTIHLLSTIACSQG